MDLDYQVNLTKTLVKSFYAVMGKTAKIQESGKLKGTLVKEYLSGQGNKYLKEIKDSYKNSLGFQVFNY